MMILIPSDEGRRIEREAERVRQVTHYHGYGIDNVFTLIERLDIDMIRYPFGRDSVLGFSTQYRGRQVIVTNASEILAREMYTAAHELGHVLFDFNQEETLFIDHLADEETEDYREKRAYYFAEVLLMPEEKLRKFIRQELEKETVRLTVVDIVKMQSVFRVSFTAMVMRLYRLQWIQVAHKEMLLDEKKQVGLYRIFQQLNMQDDLLTPFNRIHIPEKYVTYMLSNYHCGHIPRSSLEKALALLGCSHIELDTQTLDTPFECLN